MQLKESFAEKYAMKHNLNVRDILEEWDKTSRSAIEKGHHLHEYAQAIIEGCRMVYDFDRNIVRYMNIEVTPEPEVESRSMTREECQIKLPLTEDRVADAANTILSPGPTEKI